MLSAALYDILPPVTRDRRDKKGFTFPFEDWIQAVRAEYSGSSHGTDLLKSEGVEQVWQHHAKGKVHRSRAWSLLALTQWADKSS